MCSWRGCAHSCLLAGQPRGVPRAHAAVAQAAPQPAGTRTPPEREAGPPPGGIFACCGCLQLVPVAFLLRLHPGPRPPSAGKIAGPTRRRATRVRRGPAPGPRPHSSGPARSCRPLPPTWSGRPPGPARPASDQQQGRGLLPAPGSPNPLEVRAGAAIAPPRPRPLTPAAATYLRLKVTVRPVPMRASPKAVTSCSIRVTSYCWS
ncbi:hypothetical protein NDU88_004737 [Pleurodeles waltl]|uniref:Uncharacterized protein n=1 Tax=Pleurodeles waltl TaxID=8319 RepID=A0AAV7QJ90_PLEWA|nr:hypothetical protein NDU88_004737 [Pleurodeles waltl]